jgi:hypothetical protein
VSPAAERTTGAGKSPAPVTFVTPARAGPSARYQRKGFFEGGTP